MKFLIIFIIIVLSLAIAVFFFQSKLLFYPTHLEKSYVFKFDMPFEEKFISYGKNKIIHGLLFKPARPVGRILYFHGNGGALDLWGYAGADLAQKLNCEVLIVDYPGYGKSSGGLPSNEKALYESADAALKELIANTEPPLAVILYGRSLGSGIASYLASQHEVRALILETPYVSIKAMAEVVFPYIPSFLVRYDLDNLKYLKNLKIPVLIIHGTADSVIPYSQGQLLAQENQKAVFTTVEGGDHNDLANFPDYWQAVENFVSQLNLKSY